MEGLVLVPLDGSVTAEHAIHYARRIARLSAAELRLVHVHAPPERSPLARLPFGPDRVAARTREERQHGADARYLDRLANQVAVGPTPVQVSWVMLEGAIEPTLLRYVERERPDLVVMATRGRGGLERVRVGSVADRLARQAAAPVLLVPPAEHPADAYRERGFGRILVALDGSAFAEEILGPARAIGALVNARYTLLQVVRPAGRAAARNDERRASPAGEAVGYGRAVAYLSRVADRLRPAGAEVDVDVAEHPDAAEAILARARETDAGMIALTTVGRGGIARMVLGSVADRVIREAAVPVLVINPNLSVPTRLGRAAAADRRARAEARGPRALREPGRRGGRTGRRRPHGPARRPRPSAEYSQEQRRP